MQSLKSKFGKFAVSSEKMAKAKGGWAALCGEEIVCSDSYNVLRHEMDKRGNCRAV